MLEVHIVLFKIEQSKQAIAELEEGAGVNKRRKQRFLDRRERITGKNVLNDVCNSSDM